MALLNYTLPLHSLAATHLSTAAYSLPPISPPYQPPHAQHHQLYSAHNQQQVPAGNVLPYSAHIPPRSYHDKSRRNTNSYRFNSQPVQQPAPAQVTTHAHTQQQQQGYLYPRPQNPFTHEDAAITQQQQQQHIQHQQQPVSEIDNNNQQLLGGLPETDSGAVTSQPLPAATPHYTRVSASAGAPGANTKTRVHAVIDYDGDYYDDDEGGGAGDAGVGRIGDGAGEAVTPIQGPIYLKNGTVPVVPLYSYPQLNNGSFVQIPILWTALSVALGLELKGEYIRGVPCIKKYQQLFCPTAGNTYPSDRISLFIDENKALMKRMYGEFTMVPDYGGPGGPTPSPSAQAARKQRWTTPPSPSQTLNAAPTSSASGGDVAGAPQQQQHWAGWRGPGVPDMHANPGPEAQGMYAFGEHQQQEDDEDVGQQQQEEEDDGSYHHHHHQTHGHATLHRRTVRQAFRNGGATNEGGSNAGSSSGAPGTGPGGLPSSKNDTGRVDACESKIEILTPYWASNSAGKIRAIVNTQHFEQAIHQEVCAKSRTGRCSGDCGCEQKYKWHRLLAYDPDNDCKGIFMDWFLFPSCCVCRCNPL